MVICLSELSIFIHARSVWVYLRLATHQRFKDSRDYEGRLSYSNSVYRLGYQCYIQMLSQNVAQKELYQLQEARPTTCGPDYIL